MTKEFAKTNHGFIPRAALPNETPTALYYTSIATALVRLNERISQLDDENLRRGLLWVKDQPWLSDEIKALLTEAMAKLTAARRQRGRCVMSSEPPIPKNRRL